MISAFSYLDYLSNNQRLLRYNLYRSFIYKAELLFTRQAKCISFDQVLLPADIPNEMKIHVNQAVVRPLKEMMAEEQVELCRTVYRDYSNRMGYEELSQA